MYANIEDIRKGIDLFMNKRIICLLLILSLCAFCAACRKQQENNPTKSGAEKTTENIAETTKESIPGVGYGEGVEDEEESSAFQNMDNNNDTTVEESINDPTEDVTVVTDAPNNDVDAENKDPAKPEATEPVESETTDPAESEDIKPTEIVNSAGTTEYEAYMNMDEAGQKAFIESFDSIDAFMAWFNVAKAEYNAGGELIEIGSGTIDLEQITG